MRTDEKTKCTLLWAGALALLAIAAPMISAQALLTVAESSGYKATSKHAEVVEYCERLVKLSPLSMQAKVEGTHRQIAEVNEQLAIVTADHNRVRENLKIIPMSSEHYKTLLEKFVVQDKQIKSHQGDLRRLDATMQTQSRDYDQYLEKLNAD